jgi:signal transduction histidine kinase
MKKYNQIIASVLGNKGEVDQERYFMTMTSFIASIFLFCLCVFHLIMNLKIAPVYFAGGSSLVLLGLYFLLRFHKCLFIPKLIITLFGLLLLDLTWFSKFLSEGPVLYFIFAFGALVIWVWNGKALIIMLLLYFLNIGILFLVERYSQGSLIVYPNPEIRIVDIYLSFFFYSLLMIFILSRIKKDFVWQKEKAIKSDKLKSAFLANMSHELRTPVNSIVGFSGLLDKETNPLKRHQFINIIQSCSSSLLSLITDLIDLSKIEAGDLNLKYSDFKIKDLFDEMKELFAFELNRTEKSNVKLSYYLQGEELIIHSDPFRVKQVLSNLLKNAIKFTNQGTITFSCRKIDNELVFSVTDTGTGIPDEDQEIIFQRFTKFDYQGLNTEGTGIGLAIADRIVALLNGKLWLSSVLGEGSSFFFSIPYIQPTNKSTTLQESEDPGLNKSASGKVVLVVEDDLASFLFLDELLKYMNINVYHVNDGRAAIDFIQKNPGTQLILMDIRLPHMSGYEATIAIKKLYPKIPIIAQTAYALTGDKEKAINAGCDDYLAKPIDPLKLENLLRKYL